MNIILYYLGRSITILKVAGPIKLLNRCKELLWRKFSQYKFRISTIINYYRYSIRYDSPADPYKNICIDPKTIDYSVPYGKPPTRITQGLGQITDGDWDMEKNLEDLEKHHTIKGLNQRFEQNKAWENTVYWNYAQKRGSSPKERCEYVDKIYRSFKCDGYVPSTDRKEKEGDIDQNTSWKNMLEIVVHIGRDGEIILHEGFHRFAIAGILNLKIPAHVANRHEKWQAFRDEIHNNGLSEMHDENIRSHPDLQDVIPDDG